MSDLRATPIRLDQALEALAAEPIDPGTAAQLERFESLLKSRRARDPFSPPNLVDELLDFIMPEIGSQYILRSERYVTLLEELSTALSGLDSREMARDMDRIGAAVLDEELRKHRILRLQRNGLIEI
jgi:hypothetical protein